MGKKNKGPESINATQTDLQNIQTLKIVKHKYIAEYNETID